jgi:hypothetical protein
MPFIVCLRIEKGPDKRKEEQDLRTQRKSRKLLKLR